MYCMVQKFDGAKFRRINQSVILTSKILTHVAVVLFKHVLIIFLLLLHTPVAVNTMHFINNTVMDEEGITSDPTILAIYLSSSDTSMATGGVDYSLKRLAGKSLLFQFSAVAMRR